MGFRPLRRATKEGENNKGKKDKEKKSPLDFFPLFGNSPFAYPRFFLQSIQLVIFFLKLEKKMEKKFAYLKLYGIISLLQVKKQKNMPVKLDKA